MDDELFERLRRIYAAIDALSDFDLSKFKAEIRETETSRVIRQDFRGGLNQDELVNLAQSTIYNVAHLRDHLKRWARRNGRQIAEVDDEVAQSQPLKLVIDLSNVDKHGPERLRGLSGKNPRLVDVNRILRMTIPGHSSAALTLNADGTPRVVGDALSRVVLTGDVVDDTDSRLGSFEELMTAAVEDWEKLLRAWGLSLS